MFTIPANFNKEHREYHFGLNRLMSNAIGYPNLLTKNGIKVYYVFYCDHTKSI
jgi:hypothetical protein